MAKILDSPETDEKEASIYTYSELRRQANNIKEKHKDKIEWLKDKGFGFNMNFPSGIQYDKENSSYYLGLIKISEDKKEVLFGIGIYLDGDINGYFPHEINKKDDKVRIGKNRKKPKELYRILKRTKKDLN